MRAVEKVKGDDRKNGTDTSCSVEMPAYRGQVLSASNG